MTRAALVRELAGAVARRGNDGPGARRMEHPLDTWVAQAAPRLRSAPIRAPTHAARALRKVRWAPPARRLGCWGGQVYRPPYGRRPPRGPKEVSKIRSTLKARALTKSGLSGFALALELILGRYGRAGRSALDPGHELRRQKEA